ncbi:hypothetical protein [Alkalihalobacillus sp. LMS39]|uniref:hypothetical protein n=1 Tax=Alkalihalobacillus sp. LMS39 TaxID=2924032 RepID=UPI001FB212AE|nr:hypothetical protein [Alkalihalobacillus sp. LMS39]UOE96097.1 hypothetical protein MM271_11060 [Alkalihalobacillus sp. LMS39]
MMRKKEIELVQALKKLEKMLKETPDNKEAVMLYKTFLKSFLRTKTNSIPLPSVEVMSVIKRKKPTIFSLLRKEASYSDVLYYLTSIEVNYQDAERKLAHIINENS